jgi:hypothetical protein
MISHIDLRELARGEASSNRASKHNYAGDGTFYLDQGLVITSTKIGEARSPMSTSEKFLRFAAECEVMAKFTRSAESRATWSRLAERWIRCAEMVERNSVSSRRHRITKDIENPLKTGRMSVPSKARQSHAHA